MKCICYCAFDHMSGGVRCDAKRLTINTALANSVGQPTEILKNTKATAACSGEVVVAAKLMAKNATEVCL